MSLSAEAPSSSPPAESSTKSVAVRLEHVERRYGEVVDNIDLEVYDGEFFSMLGPSGSGKTTTLRMIAGFEQATSGRVVLHGRDVTGVPPFERDVNTSGLLRRIVGQLGIRTRAQPRACAGSIGMRTALAQVLCGEDAVGPMVVHPGQVLPA